jgi:glutathione synthase/RimK-type ligase-like ATP-grasp enzyme
VKPNIGGSGAGVRRFDEPGALAEAAASLDLGLDRTALVQEFIPAESGRIVRVEVLDGAYLYASNFVADAPRVVGFDPFARMVDWIEREASPCSWLSPSA